MHVQASISRRLWSSQALTWQPADKPCLEAAAAAAPSRDEIELPIVRQTGSLAVCSSTMPGASPDAGYIQVDAAEQRSVAAAAGHSAAWGASVDFADFSSAPASIAVRQQAAGAADWPLPAGAAPAATDSGRETASASNVGSADCGARPVADGLDGRWSQTAVRAAGTAAGSGWREPAVADSFGAWSDVLFVEAAPAGHTVRERVPELEDAAPRGVAPGMLYSSSPLALPEASFMLSARIL